MKLSLLFTASGAEVILEPEGAHEKAVLETLRSMPLIEIKQGPVWALNKGGFYRQFDESPNNVATILVLSKPEGN